MANTYKAAKDRLKDDADRPVSARTFVLILIGYVSALFDERHATLKALLDNSDVVELGRVSLFTQVIRDPTRAFSVGDFLLQFFPSAPNQSVLPEGTKCGVLCELDDDKEVPLLLLTPPEITEIMHGSGFSTAFPPADAKVSAK